MSEKPSTSPPPKPDLTRLTPAERVVWRVYLKSIIAELDAYDQLDAMPPYQDQP